ncbi:Mitochondrial phosphate carrier protein 3 mitochondrial [Bienertia sinuspersici]
MSNFLIPSASEPSKRIEMYSPRFYAACTVGGILSCGLTHMAVTPLDLVKCNMQIDPAKYKSISSGFGVLFKEQGARGLFRGWVPTLFGYSAQGACKFGFYEFFKKYYSNLVGSENATKYKTFICLAGSASAEVIADVALCPMEAVKVRVQTQPGFAKGLSDGLPKFIKSDGASGLFKGIGPLWGRQIPCNSRSWVNTENGGGSKMSNFLIPSASEPSKRIEMYSPRFYAACTVGGILSCGLTHMAVTPLDLIDPAKYKSISSGFGVLFKEQGARGLFRGWVPTLFGYSAQGACKFGFYEFFKKYYSNLAGSENATKYKTFICLAGSASAEVIADVALCPMEAVKVRVQTQPGFAKGLSDGLPKFIKSDGASGLFKGIGPLWGRQIPSTDSLSLFLTFLSNKTLKKHKSRMPVAKLNTHTSHCLRVLQSARVGNSRSWVNTENGGGSKMSNFLIPSASEPSKRIEMYSPRFYAACTVGGILSCGLTHMAVTPLDLVKCNMQV